MELKSIYRTYRPQRWEDVVGQELIVRTLTNEIAHDTLVHAYLFTGTRGVGKTTTARLLAKTVNCEKRKKGEVEPCNTCGACIAITEGRSLDVMEIDAASHTGVDNVRENVIAASRVSPLERKMKVFIIDEVHMLSTAAFNALLKTIEEPSAQVLFILATTDSDRVPETIISRCQRFDFRRVNEKDIAKRLEAIAKKEGTNVEPDVLQRVIRAAGGSLRDAESMLGQLLGIGKKKITSEDISLLLPQGDEEKVRSFIDALFAHDAKSALACIDEVIDRGGEASVFLSDCIVDVRNALLADVRGDGKKYTAPREELALLLRQLLQAERDAAVVDPPALAIELLIAEYATVENAGNTTMINVVPKKEKPATPKVESKTKETPVTKPSTNSSGFTLAEIHDRWHHVVATAKKYNHSLALILKVAVPVTVKESCLTLGFRYSFHADRLDDPTTRGLATRILEEVFATPFSVRTSVVPAESVAAEPAPETKASGGNTLLSDLLSTFGGKVVKKPI